MAVTTRPDPTEGNNTGSSADAPKHGAADADQQWAPHPWLARLIRIFAFLFPIAMSVVFVMLVSKVVPSPAGWFGRVLWWIGLTVLATFVLIGFERLTRRLLPLVTLFKLSIAFPDEAPSRFKMAMRTNTVRQLERQLKEGSIDHTETPAAAAEHLLELANMLNNHDRMTRGHTERVRAYTLMIGEQMGLPADELNKLHWAALIHDVGKLDVPASILNKQGKPTDEEWAILCEHPKYGAELLAPLVPWLGEWARAAEQHHERWDGKGYPYGLSGHQISRAGRIVAVADAFDVITSVRSYKAAFTPEEARAELATCAGTQFDPGVVRAFLNVSLGRLRLAMGPLSWLAQVPILARVPLTAGIGTTTASGGSAAIAATAGAAATGIAAMTGLAVPNVVGDESDPAVPGAPVAAVVVVPDELVDIVGSLDEDGVYDIGVDDIGADGADVVSAGDPSVGTVRMLDDGTMRFVPPADYFGPADFAVEGCWGDDCRSADVALDVLPVNDAPRPGIDIVEMLEDGRVNVDVLANDSDPEGDALTLVSASVADVSIGRRQAAEPAGIDLSVIGQELWLAPPDDYFGTVSIDYTVADEQGARAGGRVTIAISSVNDVPVALDDNVEGVQGSEARVAVLANDYDVDGDVLDVSSVSSATLSPTVSGDTVVIPLDGAIGDHLVDYTVIDGDGAANDARVVVTITASASDDPPPPPPPSPPPPPPPSSPTTPPPPPPGNEPPMIGNRTLVVDEDTNGEVDVAAATTDSDGTVDPTSLTVTRGPRATLGSVVVFDGAIVFVPKPDAFGTTSVGVSICDDDGDCATADVPVVVEPVNDPPSFELLTERITVAEDTDLLRGPLVTSITAGPANESDQDVTFDVWYPPANEDLFDVPPFVSVDGTARVRPAPDASGQSVIRITATDSGGPGQQPLSVSANVLYVVDEVNDAPTFGHGSPFAVFEDSGPFVGSWIFDIEPGPAAEADQTVSFDIDVPPGDAALFSAQPTIDGNGVLRFTPAADVSGSTEMTVTASDSGGTAVGGVDTADPVTLSLAIFEVNDPPTIASTAGPVTVDEDSGGYDAVWATGISSGPPAEAAQAVGFEVDVPPGDEGLFSELPHVTPDGQLHFTPAIDGYGVTTLTVRPVDDGGTPNGGDDTGLDETLVLTVDPLNDAPRFMSGGDVVVVENSGPQTITGWATGISPGPNEAGQSVSFSTAVLAAGPGFATAPAVAPNGDLTFEAAFLGTGTATIEVTALDDGPTGGANVNQSVPETFTITATPAANQPPVAGGVSVPGTEDGGSIDIDVTPYVSDPDDLVTSLSASLSITETPRGASITVVGPRTIRYTPAPDVYGDDAFTYRIADPDLATDTATIVVQLANTPDAPVADDDGYVTPKNTQLAVPAPLGVLGNDVDVDPGALTASIDTPPAVGAVALAGDGSFTFDPPPGFTGRTSFTYRATGAAGSDVATVDILVDSGVGTPTVYLGQTGPDPEHYDFLFSPPAPADPEPDVDMDGYGGHTLVDAGVPGTGGDPARSQSWVLELPNFGELDGPGHLDVWSQVRDTAAMGPDAMLRAEVYECAPDLTGCVRFAEASAYDENWSSGWASRVINLGHITRSLTPGNVVKLYVESSHADLLVAASGTRPSRLVGTSPNQAPEVADIDLTGPAGILEGATVVIDLAAATTDIDIVPGLTAVTAGPSNGQIVDNGDGTVSYTPDPGFSGDDQFDFELTDSNGQTGSATVFIQVIDTNGQPYMTEPEGALTVWTPDATGEVRPNGNWRIVFDVEPGYQTGVQVGQYFVQGPIILTIGGMTAGDNEWGEDLSLVIDSVSDPDGVIDWMSGFILKPGDWYGFYYASDYTHFVDFATTDNEGTAVVKLRLDDGNATNNLSDDLIVIRIKNYD